MGVCVWGVDYEQDFHAGRTEKETKHDIKTLQLPDPSL